MQTPLRVVMVSKALVVGVYQRKAEAIALMGIDLTVLTPPYWRDARGSQPAEALYTQGYALRTIPCRHIGDFHLHHYPTLARELAALRPDILHMDEEPYNRATWEALRAATRLGIRSTFFTWQNILRRYPPPFAQMEQSSYRHAPIALAGSAEAADVLRAKGYQGEVAIIPQFGVDPGMYSPAPAVAPGEPLRIGYAGGLLPEKGVDLLLHACARLRGTWRLTLFGEGRAQGQLEGLAAALGIAPQVHFAGRVPGAAMADRYRALDVLVLPSRTTPTWKEQFGRVLIEAMASGVVVVGSSSGEIPHVIGDGGLVFTEGDAAALHANLQALLDNPASRRALAAAGRARALACYSTERIAAETVAFYRRLMESNACTSR
jgi:glycosyltransferase involved in cell wall biosynthesis